jgi:hypothetical protein
MSSDVLQMRRSCEIVLAEYREKYPQFRDDLDDHLADMMHWLTLRALVGGHFLAARELLKRLVVMDPAGVVSRPAEHAKRVLPGEAGSAMAESADAGDAQRQGSGRSMPKTT